MKIKGTTKGIFVLILAMSIGLLWVSCNNPIGGGGGSSPTPIYTIQGYIKPSEGNVTADVDTAAEGDTITLTATPAEGYVLKADGVTVYRSGGAPIEVTAAGNNWTFIMPGSNVQVHGEFVSEIQELRNNIRGLSKTSNWDSIDTANTALANAISKQLTTQTEIIEMKKNINDVVLEKIKEEDFTEWTPSLSNVYPQDLVAEKDATHHLYYVGTQQGTSGRPVIQTKAGWDQTASSGSVVLSYKVGDGEGANGTVTHTLELYPIVEFHVVYTNAAAAIVGIFDNGTGSNGKFVYSNTNFTCIGMEGDTLILLMNPYPFGPDFEIEVTHGPALPGGTGTVLSPQPSLHSRNVFANYITRDAYLTDDPPNTTTVFPALIFEAKSDVYRVTVKPGT